MRNSFQEMNKGKLEGINNRELLGSIVFKAYKIIKINIEIFKHKSR